MSPWIDAAPLADSQPRITAKGLADLSPVRSLAELAGTWALIIGGVSVYLAFPSPLVFMLIFLLVASRQYALLILMHDAFHSLLHPNRLVNEALGSLLIAYPCGSSYWPARASHLAHHRTLGLERDPELPLYSAADKRRPARFVAHFVRLVLGGQLLYTHVGMAGGAGDVSAGPCRRLARTGVRMLPVGAAQIGILALFALAGSWQTYLTLWVLPLATLTVLFNGLRVFCDHANLTDQPGDERHRLVSYVSNRLERFFLAPFHMNYHAEHHLFPYVPHYRLPRLRAKLRASVEHLVVVQWRATYAGFIRRFLTAR